jgi:hypothetical protein
MHGVARALYQHRAISRAWGAPEVHGLAPCKERLLRQRLLCKLCSSAETVLGKGAVSIRKNFDMLQRPKRSKCPPHSILHSGPTARHASHVKRSVFAREGADPAHVFAL